MKSPNLNELTLDRSGTELIRSKARGTRKIKITINIDEDSIKSARKIADETGIPYQKLINQILREGLLQKSHFSTRLDRLERELEKLKKKVA